MLTIGRLARSVALESQTLRYYDRVGLVRPATRTPSGYRLYDDAAADCPCFEIITQFRRSGQRPGRA